MIATGTSKLQRSSKNAVEAMFAVGLVKACSATPKFINKETPTVT
jgi:hypothetical protein